MTRNPRFLVTINIGATEAAAELADILKKASALKRKDAHPVEIGVLPWPKASSIR